MENSHRFLPERKNRGNRMSELAKDEGKMLEDDKYGIFKEDSSDDDFNPDDVKNMVNSSSAEEIEEGEEEEDEEEGGEEEDSNEENIDNGESENLEIKSRSPKKKNKKEEEILDIDQLDIDKIDMIEDLKDRGIDISDEEELEKRMREYNEESEREDDDEVEKKIETKAVEIVKKKRGRKSKKELEMMHKKRGRKKKVVEKDDNIFLSNQPQITQQSNIELNNNKIIIENTDNNLELEEEQKEPNIQSGKSSKIKKSKKDKINRDLGIDPDLYFSNISKMYNPNILYEDNSILTIKKNCLTERIPELQYSPSAPLANLDYIELNNYLDVPSSPNKLRKKYKKKLNDEEKSTNSNNNYNNSGIIEINNNNIIINKKHKIENNENISNEELNSNNNIDIIGHKRTRNDNNLIDLFKKQKKEKPNKNVTIVGNRENPKYIYISKKILDENDEEKEIRKEEKKKRKKEKEKEEDKEKENERLNFDLEQEIDTKNIIMKYKQQEKEKKQFGIQNKYISQEQRLLESIFTELTNKQSLKTMQKLEDLNKRENYLYTSKKHFKDYVKIINSERHILEDKNKPENINSINITNNISQINIKNKNNEIKNEEKKDVINNENENQDNKEDKDNKDNKDNNNENKNDIINNNIDKDNDNDKKKIIEEYKEKEKKLNKVTVTFTNKEYFRIFNNLNKKPIKDKKEKICVITGKPAKYFDPLTKNYYSTIEAFKILRERYYQNEEDRLLFKIQTLSDLASQKKERLKKMIMSENEKPKDQLELVLNNTNDIHKNNNSIKIDSETMSIEENNENNGRGKFFNGNSALMKMINKFGLLKNDGGNEDKKVISHRIYNRNRENCVESGMLLEANKVKLIISKKIFKDKYSSKLPAPEMTSE